MGNNFFVLPKPVKDLLNVLDAFYRSNEIGNWVSPDDKNYSQYLGEENKELSDLYRTPKPKKSSY